MEGVTRHWREFMQIRAQITNNQGHNWTLFVNMDASNDS